MEANTLARPPARVDERPRVMECLGCERVRFNVTRFDDGIHALTDDGRLTICGDCFSSMSAFEISLLKLVAKSRVAGKVRR